MIGGRYLLKEQIGQGGMASVWRGEHLTLRRPIAVKFLDIEGSKDAVRERFLREARVSAAVHHRYVVDILDFGATPAGRPYMVMELLEGRSLFDRLNDGTGLRLPEIVRIIARLLSGLDAVHAAGIVHGDLKPENILLLKEDGREDVPKLLDFGISRAAQRDPAQQRVRSVLPSSENVVAGTPHYMSPEQAIGEADIDARSDIFAVGTILYELLTGVSPFDAENPLRVIDRVRACDAVPIGSLRPDLHPDLVAAVERAMAKKRSARFGSAKQLRAALLAGAAAHARATGTGTPPTELEGDSLPPVDDTAADLMKAAEDQYDGPPQPTRSMAPTIQGLDTPKEHAAPRRGRVAVAVAIGVAVVAAALWALVSTRPAEESVTELPVSADAPIVEPTPSAAEAVAGPTATPESGPSGEPAPAIVRPTGAVRAGVGSAERGSAETPEAAPSHPAASEGSARPGGARTRPRRHGTESLVRDPGF